MPRPARLLLSLASSAALAAGALAVAGPPGQAAPADGASAAIGLIKADAKGGLTLRTAAGGGLSFVGVQPGASLDVPGISATTGVQAAADAVMERYGAAFGADRSGTTFAPLRSPQATVAGDVVRYQQEVGGLPVLGGEVVVSLSADRAPQSVLAETSRVTRVPDAKVGEAAARQTAVAAFTKSSGEGGAPSVTSLGRWVLDPTVIGGNPTFGARTGWRFEIRRAADERRMVVVDDATGSVLANADLVNHALRRTVCDNNNVPQVRTNSDEAPCVNPATDARTEGDPATGIEDVDKAYDLAGAVSATYAAIGLDLTDTIGRQQADGTKALAQTVRLCYTGVGGCPYQNAFWNGDQMYYGTGFAGADDVVGHEMTHGVTERTSGLLYWGQSGAINESISDIMGEIVDHRNVSPGDATPGLEWALGEDVPGFPEGLRDMRDPAKFGNPDRTGSPLYVREDIYTDGDGYPDGDGVHSNSGVGNKTFYLISQGGSFNGVNLTGIDTGDAGLTKSAKLWLAVDNGLSSGSDYADLGLVLQQSCASLQTAGVMTAANCDSVRLATQATELAKTPVNNAQPDDATLTCPGDAVPRTLFKGEDPETDAAAKFTAGPGWNRTGIEGFGPNAKSGKASWAIEESATTGASSLVTKNGIALPAGRTSYLYFQHWRLLEYVYLGWYDAGTVEIDSGSGPVDAAGLPWVNGPEEPIFDGDTNPAGGRDGFGGDSHGYVASRVDLSALAGKSVKPQWTLNTDSSTSYLGWYVDDIQVYTCDPKVVVGKVKAKGRAVAGKKLKAVVSGLQPGATLAYQWERNGKVIAGATDKKYTLKRKDRGKKISVVVTATSPTYAPTVKESRDRKVQKAPKKKKR